MKVGIIGNGKTISKSFTRELRLLRRRENETSIEMAKKLRIKVSELSSVENGKAPIKKDFLDYLFKNYDLNNLEKENFKKYAAQHNKKMGVITLDFRELSEKLIEELRNKMEEIFLSDDEMVQLRYRIKEFEGALQEIEGKILFSKACHLKEKEKEYQETKETLSKFLEEMREEYKKLSQEAR